MSSASMIPFLKRLQASSFGVDVSKTRPADTTTYAAGDVLSNSTSAGTVWTFANMATAAGRGGMLQNAMLISSAAPTLKLDAELWLFDTTIASNLNDNAAAAVSDSEIKTCVGVVYFPSGGFAVPGANSACPANALSMNYKCASADTSLYGLLIVRNAYVPISAEEFTIRLLTVRD